MIIFELGCSHGHRFEGWFGSADDYTRQRATELVRCPVCDDAAVSQVPSAKVHVGKGASSHPPARASVPPSKAQPQVTGAPAELLRQLRALVRNTEDVGSRFPEEARKIHYEESPARSIRGHASAEDAQQLRDEGIEFASLPPFLTEETH